MGHALTAEQAERGEDCAQADPPAGVVGIDGSDRAADAVALGALLSRLWGHELRLVHVHAHRHLEAALEPEQYRRVLTRVAQQAVLALGDWRPIAAAVVEQVTARSAA